MFLKLTMTSNVIKNKDLRVNNDDENNDSENVISLKDMIIIFFKSLT